MSLLTSAPLHLTYAGGLYDRTAPLATGEVRPEGIDLNYVPVVPPEAFWRQLKHNEFDVSEMSCANYLTVFSRGDRRFVAIPSTRRARSATRRSTSTRRTASSAPKTSRAGASGAPSTT